MQQIFIAPPEIHSPRWQQAFAGAQVLPQLPNMPVDGLVWLYLQGDDSWASLQTLAAAGQRLVAMTAIEQPQQARRALELGALGYVHYLAVPEVLTQVASVVANGGLWLGADLMRQLITATARALPPSPQVDLSLLTSRERLVAEAVAAGKSNKEAARDLAITERTVKAHLGAIFDKLQVRDRLQLVLLLSGRTG